MMAEASGGIWHHAFGWLVFICVLFALLCVVFGVFGFALPICFEWRCFTERHFFVGVFHVWFMMSCGLRY